MENLEQAGLSRLRALRAVCLTLGGAVAAIAIVALHGPWWVAGVVAIVTAGAVVEIWRSPSLIPRDRVRVRQYWAIAVSALTVGSIVVGWLTEFWSRDNNF